MNIVDAMKELIGRQDYEVQPSAMWISVPDVGCMFLSKGKPILVMVDDKWYREATEDEITKLDKLMSGKK